MKLFQLTAALALAATTAATSLGAQSATKPEQLPRTVASEISALVYACRQAGDNIIAPSKYLSIADIDGDRKADYVVDPSKGCEANRKAKCATGDCQISVHLSSKGGTAVALRGSQTTVEVSGGQAAVKLVRAADCPAQNAQCQDVLRYQAGELIKQAR